MYILVKFMNYFLILFMRSNKLGHFWKATPISSYIIMNYLTIKGNSQQVKINCFIYDKDGRQFIYFRRKPYYNMHRG